jgi:hypothetical protein
MADEVSGTVPVPEGWAAKQRHPHVSRYSECGSYVVCRTCSSAKEFVVKSRSGTLFKIEKFKSHCKSKSHLSSIEVFDNQQNTKRKQSSIASFIVRKKPPPSNTHSIPAAASVAGSSTPVIAAVSTKSVPNFSRKCGGVFSNREKDLRKIQEALGYHQKYSVDTDPGGRAGKYVVKFDEIRKASLRLFSSDCEFKGIMYHNLRIAGIRCGCCEKFRGEQLNYARTVLNEHVTRYKAVEVGVLRTSLIEEDLKPLKAFQNINVKHLNVNGLILKDRVRMTILIYGESEKLAKALDKKKPNKASAIKERPGIVTIVDKFDELFNDHPELRESMPALLLKVAAAKACGIENPPFGQRVLDLFCVLHSTNLNSFEFVSSTFAGPSLRHMQRLNAKSREESFILHSKELVMKRLAVHVALIVSNGGIEKPSFSLSFDATKVPALLQFNTSYKAMVGAEHPHHYVPIGNASKEDIVSLLGNPDYTAADEVKVALVTFQFVPAKHSPYFVIAGRPQSKNLNSDFNDVVTDACSEWCLSTSKARLLNTSNDGVSSDSVFVWQQIIQFLLGEQQHSSSTDTNHNMKNGRYHFLIGGNTLTCAGRFIIDPFLLVVAGVSEDLWRIKDFSSDLLVLRLCSPATISKLCSLIGTGKIDDNCSLSALCVNMYFMRLHLYGVNAKLVDYETRVIFIWSSAMWLTSLTGVGAVTKRNIMSATISLIFLAMRSDVHHLRLTTEEPLEHYFGSLRSQKREFTVSEMVQLNEKLDRKRKALYSSSLVEYRSPKKGYQATATDFFRATQDLGVRGQAGPFDISLYSRHHAKRLWTKEYLLDTLNEVNHKVRRLMVETFGFEEANISPFCKQFEGNVETELLVPFVQMLPSTFKFRDFSGGIGSINDKFFYRNEDDNNENNNDDNNHEDNGNNQAATLLATRDRMLRLAAEALKKYGDGLPVDANRVGNNNTNGQPISDEDEDEDESINDGDDEEDDVFLEYSVADNAMRHLRSSWADVMNIGSSAFSESWGNEAPLVILNSLSVLCLKGREQGSTNDAMKYKSLIARWFAPSHIKPVSDTRKVAVAIQNSYIIERDVIVVWKAPKEDKAHHYVVLCTYSKYYNKWYLTKEEEKPEWNPSLKAVTSKQRVLLRMLRYDKLTRQYRYASNDDVKANDMYRLVALQTITDVVGKVPRKPSEF